MAESAGRAKIVFIGICLSRSSRHRNFCRFPTMILQFPETVHEIPCLRIKKLTNYCKSCRIVTAIDELSLPEVPRGSTLNICCHIYEYCCCAENHIVVNKRLLNVTSCDRLIGSDMSSIGKIVPLNREKSL